MTKELILFAVFFGIGVIFRILYKATTLLEKKINKIAIGIIFDIFLAFIGIGSIVTATFFLNDGVLGIYMLIAPIMGFILTSLIF